MNLPPRRAITRREAIHRLGLIGIGAALGACGDGSTAGSSADEGLDLPASCVLSPRQIEGPFFVDTGMMRRDITEGRPGVPLTVRLQLVDVDFGCEPVAGAVVEIWHSDAGGIYSGFGRDAGNLTDARGETFLRGFQTTDRNGRVEFETIYPGWYPIRTTHIHAMALIDGVEQITTQIYFDQATNDEVLSMPPYDTRGPQRTRNEDDGPLRAAGDELFFDVAGSGGGLQATYLIGITRSA